MQTRQIIGNGNCTDICLRTHYSHVRLVHSMKQLTNSSIKDSTMQTLGMVG